MKLIKILLTLFLITQANAQLTLQSQNIIKDNKANFLWQDSKDVKTNLQTFKEAKEYCKQLKVDNISSWELPGFLELYSLVNTKAYNPTSFKEFKNTASKNYWSAKTFSHGASKEAFVVDFKSGAFNRTNMSDKYLVRCYKNLNK